MDKQVEFFVKMRNAHQSMIDAENEYILSMAPPEIKADTETANEKETLFSELNFEREEGPKIGTFEAAYKANNPEDKWTQAYNILKNKKATIKDRFHSESYQHSYWLYGEDRIFRQKLKPPKT